MKKKWLTAALILIVAGAAVFGVGLATGGLDDIIIRAEPRTAEFAPDEVTSLSAALTSADVRVEYAQGDSVVVDYFEAERYGVDTAVRDGVLEVNQHTERGKWNFRRIQFVDARRVVVRVPVSLAGLSVLTTSGEIEVAGLTVEGDATIGSTSGDVKVSGTFVSLEMDTTSGEIAAQDIVSRGGIEAGSTSGGVSISNARAAGGARVTTTSGAINLTNFDANSFDVGSVSGTIVARRTAADAGAGRFTAWTTSGDILLEGLLAQEIGLSSTSGEVQGQLPGSMADYTIQSGTVSGGNYLPGRQSGGAKSLSVTTTSGFISITFENG